MRFRNSYWKKSVTKLFLYLLLLLFIYILIFSVRNPSKCLFVYGSAGSGKTQMVTEGFKIMLSDLQNQGKKVRLLVTTFSGLQSDPRDCCDEQ